MKGQPVYSQYQHNFKKYNSCSAQKDMFIDMIMLPQPSIKKKNNNNRPQRNLTLMNF